ncbi:MAG: hypothetical protein K5894_09270, partial [Lachnospiraceae bacterium]|nr:hypothetical protein [Lachnospiraceae bacterium]
MIYPSTYKEMAAWVGIKKLRGDFLLTDEQAEHIYDLLRTKKVRVVEGRPSGIINTFLYDGRMEKITTQTNLNPSVYEKVTVTEA